MRKKINEGKTKRIYQIGEKTVEIISKPDITAGDGEKKDVIEDKDIFANNTTCNVFELLNKKGIKSHFIQRGSNNSFKAQLCVMIPVEVVMRRVATGSYLKRVPDILDGTIFDEVKVEFFHKDDELHDPIIIRGRNYWHRHSAKEPISDESFIDDLDPLCTNQEAIHIESEARKVFEILEEAFEELGIILWDMKIEFGRTLDGKIVLADVIDNDSWRIRDKDGNQLDKQVYRDGGDLGDIQSKYELVSKLTNKFSK